MGYRSHNPAADWPVVAMSSRRVTSYDVAELAGVSQSAVSRAFTADASVSARMRERILTAADALGYRPNAIARSLGKGRSSLLGMIVNQHTEQGYVNALRGITELLRGTGGGALLQVVDADSLADDAVTALLDYQVEAIVCSSVLSLRAAARCADAGVALCLVNRHIDADTVDEVVSDNTASSAALARELASRGAVKTAYAYGPLTSFVSRLRHAGFAAGCADAGLPEPLKVHCEFTYRGGYEAAIELIAQHPDLDVIAAATDSMAFGVMDALQSCCNKRVPEDIMVVGYDDEATAGFASYRLSTVRQPMEAMLAKAVELARERIEQPGLAKREIVMRGELILRHSTGHSPGGTPGHT